MTTTQFFKRHQKELVELADSMVGRYLLSKLVGKLSQDRIVKITPSSFIQHLEGQVFKATFVSLSPFADLFIPIIEKMTIARVPHNDEVFAHFSGLELKPHRYPTVFLNTSTFNPTTGSNSPVDGYCLRQGVDVAWSTLRGGNGTDAAGDSAGDFFMVRIAASTTSNQFSQNIVSQLLFDTSALTSVVSINSAIESFYGEAGSETGLTFSICITAAVPASNATIAISDYQTRLFTRFNSADIANGSWNASGYNDFTFNATGRAAISKTGITKTCLTSDKDADNVAPTWSSAAVGSVKGLYADNGSNIPKLVVVFTLPGAIGAGFFNFLV